MIYLIDDNKKRQQDSGWSNYKFEEYKDFIQPIYRLSEVTDDHRNELFRNENNVILFHESFFENFENKQANDVNDIRNKLEKLSNTTSTRYYVIFSGSNSERKLNENNKSASIPVHILYNNLEIFIKQFQNGNEYNLKYLLYGTNPDIEPFLLEELNKSNRLFIEDSLNLTNEVNDYFFFRSKLDVNPISENHTTIFNKDSEFGFHNIINNSLSKIEYKGIFVPLCFGNSLSDFNGLRLATEIRCTNTLNQFTPIFIYSFVSMEYLLQNEYFNILKTKGVELVDYGKKAFQDASSSRTSSLKTNELPKEIKKLELQPPKNYLDNHSIANEWAIHQWSKTIGCDETEELKKVFQNVKHNLYFKYLRTIYPIYKQDVISPNNLKIDYEGKHKVLLIDDEAEKGWFEIFCHLLCDNNKIDLEHLDDEFNSKNQNEIISISIDKVKSFNPDVVILDLRLHATDFEKKNISEITGFKILNKIKKHNEGIQVIIFSATNKIWNLLALQKTGADGFIIKEAPENSVDSDFHFQSIKNIIYNINDCLKMKFLKKSFDQITQIKTNLKLQKITVSDEVKKLYSRVESNLEIAFNILTKSKQNDKYINFAYLQFFQIVEDFANYYFEVGEKCYVKTNDNSSILVMKKNISSNKYDCSATYIEANYFYKVQKGTFERRIDVNCMVSNLLIFRYGNENSNCRKWKTLNHDRNTKAAHFNESNTINKNEIFDLLEFIIYIFDSKNVNEKNKIHELDDLIDTRALIENFNNKQ